MTKTIRRDKWILYRHTRSADLLGLTAETLKYYSKTGITKADKTRINNRLKELGAYSERNPNMPLDAINHKINQLSYYMYGYQVRDGEDSKFMFSPLGNLYLKYIDDKERRAKIFLAMIWAAQYPHPHSGTSDQFFLYPFRLIYKLLRDPRLGGVLYAYEIALYVVFTCRCTNTIYEQLVETLLATRKKNNNELILLFEADRHAYVNATYEWDYYVSNLFADMGVLEKKDGEIITKLQHGNTNTYRKISRNRVSIPQSLIDLVDVLELAYPATDTPLDLKDKERLRIDVVKEIYNFYPTELLTTIGEEDESAYKMLEIPHLIEEYSNNPENETAYLFESALVDSFNMFYNVKSKRKGLAGHTDIECLYITLSRKFAVEAKSTANKLLGINPGRLREHREEIGGAYTIVITPRYVPAAARDIKGTPNVILLASTFSEFLYNCIVEDLREIDYGALDNIISANLGSDISSHVSDLSLQMFATKTK